MGFSLKSVGKFVTGGLKKVPGLGQAVSVGDALINKKPILKTIGKDLKDTGKWAATIAPFAGGGAALAGAGGGGGLISKAGGFLMDNPDLVLGGLSAIQGAKAQGKADKLSAQALAHETGRYNELAPLRTMGMQGLQNKQRPDLSGIYAGSSNPFSRPLRPVNMTAPGPQAENPLERPLREITMPRSY